MRFEYKMENKKSIITAIHVRGDVITVYYSGSKFPLVVPRADKEGKEYHYIEDGDHGHDLLHEDKLLTEKGLFHYHIKHNTNVMLDDLKYLIVQLSLNTDFFNISLARTGSGRRVCYLDWEDENNLVEGYRNYLEEVAKHSSSKSSFSLVLRTAVQCNGDGAREYNNGNYSQAIEFYNKAITILENAASHQANNHDNSIEIQEKLAIAYYNKGSTYLKMKQFEESAKWFKQALATRTSKQDNLAKRILDKMESIPKTTAAAEAVVDAPKGVQLNPPSQ